MSTASIAGRPDLLLLLASDEDLPQQSWWGTGLVVLAAAAVVVALLALVLSYATASKGAHQAAKDRPSYSQERRQSGMTYINPVPARLEEDTIRLGPGGRPVWEVLDSHGGGGHR